MPNTFLLLAKADISEIVTPRAKREIQILIYKLICRLLSADYKAMLSFIFYHLKTSVLGVLKYSLAK